MSMHSAEQQRIEVELTTMLPENISEVCCLLDFAMKYAGDSLSTFNDVEIAIPKNVRSGIRQTWRNDLAAERARIEALHAQDEAERTKGVEKMRDGIALALASAAMTARRRGSWGA